MRGCCFFDLLVTDPLPPNILPLFFLHPSQVRGSDDRDLELYYCVPDHVWSTIWLADLLHVSDMDRVATHPTAEGHGTRSTIDKEAKLEAIDN